MQLAIYEQAKHALAEYKTVDEVKDFRDKAMAIEAYAKQANDMQLEWDAAKARVRAERKCGELLRDTEKAKGSAGNQHTGRLERSCETTSPKTLSEMGVTKDQSSKWQRLAAIPEAEFEAAISSSTQKPSTNHIVKPAPKTQPRMSSNALWFWGVLDDMRKNNLFSEDINALTSEWTDGMSRDFPQLINQLKQWVNKYE